MRDRVFPASFRALKLPDVAMNSGLWVYNALSVRCSAEFDVNTDCVQLPTPSSTPTQPRHHNEKPEPEQHILSYNPVVRTSPEEKKKPGTSPISWEVPDYMAETGGFEPPRDLSTPTFLAGRRTRPDYATSPSFDMLTRKTRIHATGPRSFSAPNS